MSQIDLLDRNVWNHMNVCKKMIISKINDSI